MKFQSHLNTGYTEKEIQTQIKRYKDIISTPEAEFKINQFIIGGNDDYYQTYIDENKRLLKIWELEKANPNKHKKVNMEHLQLIKDALYSGSITHKIAHSLKNYLRYNKSLTDKQLLLLSK